MPDHQSLMVYVGYGAAVVLLMFVGALWSGYVLLSTLWAWFIVPSLNAPPLSIPAAIGVALVISRSAVMAVRKRWHSRCADRIHGDLLEVAEKRIKQAIRRFWHVYRPKDESL